MRKTLNTFDFLHGSVGAADKVMSPVIEGLRDAPNNSMLMKKRAAQRYSMLHRNNPAAKMQFVAENMPAGANPIAELARYEKEMETLLKDNGWTF